MGLPSFSVVLPNYNHGMHLPKWFESVLQQSLQPSEIIVIDDASTDNSMEILNEFARRCPLMRVFQNDRNRGVGYGVNRGLNLATGEYIFFSASDDEVAPGFFSKSMQLLSEHPQAALSCTVSEWHYVGTQLTWHMSANMTDRPAYLSPNQMVELGRSGRLFIVSQSAIMKKLPLVEAGGFIPELRWHNDWFAVYVTGFRHGICHVPEVLSRVNIYTKSYSQAGRRSVEHPEVLRRILALLGGKECEDVADRIRDSSVLSVFGWPLLKEVVRMRLNRRFLSALLIARCLRRSGELLGRAILPQPLARSILRLLYQNRNR